MENRRTIVWDDPHELGREARGLSGLEFLRRLIAVVHRGKRTAVTEARMEDSEGRLYAHASSTCLILES